MIVKFNSRGAGAGSGPVDYLLGKERNREQAKTLRGDPERVKTLIDTCDFARTYTSGVLSFEEKDLPDVDKQQLMDELEQTLLPGLDKDQYSILWVEHQDKGRLELNFVIPNIELHSGKRLQPYYDRADRPRVNAWQTLTNDRLGLSDPNDPERRRELTPGRDLPKNSQKAAESITAGLSHLAMQGLVRNRQDVINVLESAGMTIARETKSSISIASPDGGKNLRLKGALYERDFRFSESLRGELEAAGATYRDARESRISEAERCYQRGIELKREEYQQRYPRRDPTTPTALENHLPAGNEMAVDWPVIHRPDLRRTDRGNLLVSEPATRGNTDQRTESSRAEFQNGQGDRGTERDRQIPRSVLHHPAEARQQHTDLPLPETNGSELQRQITQERSPEPLSDDLTHSGKESHDRDRKTLVERIRELTTRLKDTAASLTRQFQEFTGHVRENTARESSLSQSLHEAEPASRGLEQASKRLEQHSESLSQTVAAKELSQLKENDRGMSL
ncbi:relaxase/mobilization nuclease domain-containing protein [Salmonella sp. C3246]|nr:MULTISPECIES: relaxase/mobilization nuclease domain-containing protein [Enterobacteriaceae]MCL9281631.1 relaxase/mobilization nuclease domain-containing protein [Salmonella enterica subsp. enterica serovar Enteritidis]EFH9168990.1 relaxase [Escherichia coli]MCH5842843.1 relaxase/mobilization nuclease domain-containing protein [Salmonella enterica]MCH5861789.1 relaxase/mobilization nuclease domain-containing protein [Salmonella enterica]MCH5875519.1 relaxase/mobilization nuclease domain-cont